MEKTKSHTAVSLLCIVLLILGTTNAAAVFFGAVWNINPRGHDAGFDWYVYKVTAIIVLSLWAALVGYAEGNYSNEESKPQAN